MIPFSFIRFCCKSLYGGERRIRTPLVSPSPSFSRRVCHLDSSLSGGCDSKYKYSLSPNDICFINSTTQWRSRQDSNLRTSYLVGFLAGNWFKPLTHCSKDKGQIAEYYLYDNILLSLIYKLPKLTWR